MLQRNRLAKSAAVALSAAATMFGGAVQAQDYPTKPITLIVPWPAGGSTDISMRAIAETRRRSISASRSPSTTRPAAAARSARRPMAAAAKPDGYTISQIPITVFRLPLMQQVVVGSGQGLHLHHPSHRLHLRRHHQCRRSQFKTWKDVVDFAKANPGKVTYATPGAGTSLHIGMEQIAAMAGIKLTQVPFKGGAETNAAVLGHHTMLQADSTGWRPLVDAGKLRLLMVWTAKRVAELSGCADAEGARLSDGLRFAVRHRRPEGHGPEDRRQAARRLQEGDRGSGGASRRWRSTTWCRTTRTPRTTRSSSSRSPIPSAR